MNDLLIVNSDSVYHCGTLALSMHVHTQYRSREDKHNYLIIKLLFPSLSSSESVPFTFNFLLSMHVFIAINTGYLFMYIKFIKLILIYPMLVDY